MKSIALFLFALGTPWALIAPVGAAAPIAMIEDISTGVPESILQVGFGILLSLQCILGYWIWTNWVFIAVCDSRSTVKFWSIAVLHHFAWIAFAVFQSEPQMLIASAMYGYSFVVSGVSIGGVALHLWKSSNYLTS